MTTKGTGTFAFAGWEEAPYSDVEGGAKLTHAKVQNDFSGTITGKGTLNYIMTYVPDGSAVFVGYEQIIGGVEGRAGSFVLFHEGSVTNADSPTEFTVSSEWSVVPGSGSGDLAGLSGAGRFIGRHGVKDTPYTFDYELADSSR